MIFKNKIFPNLKNIYGKNGGGYTKINKIVTTSETMKNLKTSKN